MNLNLIGQKVRIYRNLAKKTFSIMNPKTRRVVGYSKNLRLQNVIFRVSAAGRKRAVKQKRRNVHAFAEGKLFSVEPFRRKRNFKQVSYHYQRGHFFLVDSQQPINCADKAYFSDGQFLYIEEEK